MNLNKLLEIVKDLIEQTKWIRGSNLRGKNKPTHLVIKNYKIS